MRFHYASLLILCYLLHASSGASILQFFRSLCPRLQEKDDRVKRESDSSLFVYSHLPVHNSVMESIFEVLDFAPSILVDRVDFARRVRNAQAIVLDSFPLDTFVESLEGLKLAYLGLFEQAYPYFPPIDAIIADPLNGIRPSELEKVPKARARYSQLSPLKKKENKYWLAKAVVGRMHPRFWADQEWLWLMIMASIFIHAPLDIHSSSFQSNLSKWIPASDFSIVLEQADDKMTIRRINFIPLQPFTIDTPVMIYEDAKGSIKCMLAAHHGVLLEMHVEEGQVIQKAASIFTSIAFKTIPASSSEPPLENNSVKIFQAAFNEIPCDVLDRRILMKSQLQINTFALLTSPPGQHQDSNLDEKKKLTHRKRSPKRHLRESCIKLSDISLGKLKRLAAAHAQAVFPAHLLRTYDLLTEGNYTVVHLFFSPSEPVPPNSIVLLLWSKKRQKSKCIFSHPSEATFIIRWLVDVDQSITGRKVAAQYIMASAK